MLGLVAAQDVIDEVGREADLASGLALAGVLPLDEAADHRNLAKGSLQQVRTLDPFDEFALQDVGREQRLGVADRFESVAGKAEIDGDKAHWLEACSLHAP